VGDEMGMIDEAKKMIKAFAACERELALAELREEQSAELDRLRARNRDLETAFVAPLRALASGRCYWLKQADTFPDRGHAACSENLEKSRGEWCEVCDARDKLAALARRKGGI
jgi:hypothetical protein